MKKEEQLKVFFYNIKVLGGGIDLYLSCLRCKKTNHSKRQSEQVKTTAMQH